MTETNPDHKYPLLSTPQLRSLYGQVIRKYVEMGLGVSGTINDPQYALGRRMRDEITRRIGEHWLIRYYQ